MTNPTSHFSQLPRAWGAPLACGRLKSQPADFQVEEMLAFSLSGEGEHVWIWVEKEGENTDWVAQRLAKWAGIRVRDVGYAGLKDRHAVTRQWFSLYLPGREAPDPALWQEENIRLLAIERHQRKLQTGGLSGNRFILRLRDLDLNADSDAHKLETRLRQIADQGVPNYFGAQRFGRDERNLVMAQRLFSAELTRLKPAQRKLYISAARSMLFNLIVAERVAQGSWNQALEGDVFQLAGSKRWFEDDGSEGLAQRVQAADIHPTAALVGQGVRPSKAQAQSVEAQVLEPHQTWCCALAKLGLQQDRRAMRVIPQQMQWHWLDAQQLQVSFTLPAGSYATVVVREFLEFE